MIDVITDIDSAPTLTLSINSKWFSGDVTIIDMSFYEPYKEIGDNVICVFIYFGFLWNIFIRLPDIIKGAGASSYFNLQINDINAYRKTGFGRSSSIQRRGF